MPAFGPPLLRPLRDLVDLHASAVFPGCSIPEAVIAQHLTRDFEQPTIDPWAAERLTLCVDAEYQVLAAAHVIRYRDDPDVSDTYRGIGSVH